MSIFFRYTSP